MANIKVGDRVKATHKSNSDTAEFTVNRVDPRSDGGATLHSVTNFYSSHYFDFERVVPALPTTPGVYGITPNRTNLLLLSTDGVWYWFDPTSTHPRFVATDGQGIHAYSKPPTLLYAWGSEFPF